MALNQQQRASSRCDRFLPERIETRLDGILPRRGVEPSDACELINLNHLIEDAQSLMPVESAVVSYDLAEDLPLIEGDYQHIRRSLFDLLADVYGTIFLSTQVVHADRAYLNDHFPGETLPEGEYVVMQLFDEGFDAAGTRMQKTSVRGRFIFPCAAW